MNGQRSELLIGCGRQSGLLLNIVCTRVLRVRGLVIRAHVSVWALVLPRSDPPLGRRKLLFLEPRRRVTAAVVMATTPRQVVPLMPALLVAGRGLRDRSAFGAGRGHAGGPPLPLRTPPSLIPFSPTGPPSGCPLLPVGARVSGGRGRRGRVGGR